MPQIRCLQIDAFTAKPFAGNPAAVCLLAHQRDPRWMQAVAAEMNLSETAFVQPGQDGFELRWFTPVVEVSLCGHATLASAHALWEEGIVEAGSVIRFHTKSGLLTATQRASAEAGAGETSAMPDSIELDFPATECQRTDPPAGLVESLAVRPTFVGRTKFDLLVAVGSDAEVRALKPDFERLKSAGVRGVIVTAASDDPRYDFVSRFFAPGAGINEDPVTGSAHCCLAPFWHERLGKAQMVGYQASLRGGVVHVDHVGDRVLLGGQAVTVWRGELSEEAGEA